jgi:hypothetical protein
MNIVYNKRLIYPVYLVLSKQFSHSHIQTNVKFGPLKNFIPDTELKIIVDEEKFNSRNELKTIHVEQFMDFTEFMDFIEEYERK